MICIIIEPMNPPIFLKFEKIVDLHQYAICKKEDNKNETADRRFVTHSKE